MTQPVPLPELGSDIVSLSAWFAEPGEHIFEGDRLVEVRLGPATFDVSAPFTGHLVERLVPVGQLLHPGQHLALIEPDADGL